MTISPTIRRLHQSLDQQQLAVIAHGDGPLLILAGPGSGKTVCICLRALNLLLTGQVEPQHLLLCTFTRATAHEMRERVGAIARAAGYRGDLSSLRITTIHGLSHRLLSAHGANFGLAPSGRLLSAWEQLDLLKAHFHRIFGPDLVALEQHGWRTAQRVIGQARRFFDRIADELVDDQDLINSHSPFTTALGHCYARYRLLLQEQGAVDFAGLQTQALVLLQNPGLAANLGGSVHHLLVDEYQDTNYAQQQLLFRLAAVHRNICVVGDEDQLIYRFRGANPQGFGAFRQHFPDADVGELTANYRSHRDIVATCNRWISSFDWSNPHGAPFRYNKILVPGAHHADADHPAVISIRGQDKDDEADQLAILLRLLKGRRFIADYGQVAILLPSVKSRHSQHYIDALTRAGIPVAPTQDTGFADQGADHGLRFNGASTQPAGRVLITTIHQAKGREWPVVFVGNLHHADLRPDELETQLGPHITRGSAEPASRTAMFDLARQYYVAFSRAQRMLVLSARQQPHPIFAPVMAGVPNWTEVDLQPLTDENASPFPASANQTVASTSLQLVVPRSGVLTLTPATNGPLHLAYRTAYRTAGD